MNINLRKPAAALAGFIAIALSACGGSSSSSGDSGGGGTTDTPPLTAPTISAPAENQSVVKGETATFKVVATGSALTYQWKKNGTDISGATSSSYTTPPTSIADNNTAFSVKVSNSAGSVNSAATLTVLDTAVAATITTQPADQTAITGQTVTFSVTATGTSLQYQWKKGDTVIPGATSSSYTTPATSSADNDTKYSVIVSNKVSTVTSNMATLTVSDKAVAPAITTQPAAQSVTAGQTATFLVKASGTSLQYQWKKGDTAIPGATSSTYTTPATSMADSGAAYSVSVSNSEGTVTSNNATLTVTAAVVVPVVVAPAISTQPAAQTVTEGQTATFSVTATGTAPLTYQWKKNGTNIEGVTTSSHTTDATVLGDSGAVFTVVVSNSAGNVTSGDATLTVNPVVPPAISAQPAAQSITAGDTATFSVTATGTGTLSYQWKKNGINITGGMGATTSSYTTPAMSYAGNSAVYSVEVSNSAGTVTSGTATLTVTKASALQSYGYVANASDGLYDKTECVQDNNTGLVWEGKTATPATTRLGTSRYTNFDSTSSAQKPDGSNPTQTEIDASTNSIGYKNSVNTSALCGYTDCACQPRKSWRGFWLVAGVQRLTLLGSPIRRLFCTGPRRRMWAIPTTRGSSISAMASSTTTTATATTMCAWCGRCGVAYTSVFGRHSHFGLARCIQTPWQVGSSFTSPAPPGCCLQTSMPMQASTSPRV